MSNKSEIRRASNLIIRIRKRVRARPHMLKFWRRWKGARYLKLVSVVQRWIRRWLYRTYLKRRFLRWRASSQRVVEIICRAQRRWRYHALSRGGPACALLDHRVSAAIIRKTLGADGVRELYMAIALKVKPRRQHRRVAESATRFVRKLHQIHDESMLERGQATAQARGRVPGTSGGSRGQSAADSAGKPHLRGNANSHEHMHRVARGRKGGVLTLGIDSKEDTKLNHMGLPGTR